MWWPPGEASADTDRLTRLGWDADRQAEFEQLDEPGVAPSRVARVDRGICTVFAADGVHRAAVPPRAALPAVGDWAAVRPAVPGGDDAVVRALLTRRTSFTRQAAGEETAAQVVAANVDVVLLLSALDQRFSLRRLERYLTLGWQSGARPVIVLTKTDLSDEAEQCVIEAESIAFGVDVLAVSAVTGDGLERLREQISGPAVTIALLGLSGAGKSTLVNRLVGRDVLQTQDVREDGRGRHTTTHRELVALPGGGVLIDTPGMRSVSLWDDDSDAIDQTFADVQELAGSCRFSDCRHDGEPGCAVGDAISSGALPQERLDSYNKLLRELRFQQLKQDKRARSDERRRWRTLSKAMRNSPKAPGE